MSNRIELQTILERLLGNKNVYFQPPSTINISYPCVIYNIGNGDIKYANDSVYKLINSYELIFIYKKPMIDLIEDVLITFSMSKFTRYYTSNNLNHYVFNIYF